MECSITANSQIDAIRCVSEMERLNGFGLGDRQRNEACANPVLCAGRCYTTNVELKTELRFY